MKKLILFVLILLSSVIYSDQWSKNGVWKYHASRLYNRNTLLDYENLNLAEYYFNSISNYNTWIRTPNIYLGSEFVVKDMFINVESIFSNEMILYQLRQSENDRILEQTYVSNNAVLPLINIFEKNIYLTMSFKSTNLKIFSFGVTRQAQLVVQKKELVLHPSLLFFGEGSLDISLKLHFPAWLDIIIYDQYGTVIDNILLSDFYKQGDYHFTWNPEKSTYPALPSGVYFVYVKTLSTEGKVVELESNFWMAKQ